MSVEKVAVGCFGITYFIVATVSVFFIGFLLVFLYFMYFKKTCSCFSSFVCVSTVVASICFIVLLPVDVYLVSATKDDEGFHKDWATTESIMAMEKIVLCGYYGVYGLIFLFIFGFIPFDYFASKSLDDKELPYLDVLRGSKFLLVSVITFGILLVIGSVVPMGDLPVKNTTLYNQLNYVHEMDWMQSEVENALVFTYNCLGLIGMICSTVYVTYGMVIMPINLIKGPPKEKREERDFELSAEQIKSKIQEINSKVADHRPLSDDDRHQLAEYSRRLSALQSASDTYRHRSYKCTAQISCVWRPLQVMIGLIFLSFSWFIVVTIIISNVNRLVSSQGMKTGYTVNQTVVENPLSSLLLLCHKAFPLDSVVFGLVVAYFALSSASGMQHMGLWFFWVKLHRLRRGMTATRALILSSLIVALVTLYSGVLAYSLAPQYVTYGTQTYRVLKNTSWETVPCSFNAPANKCLLTRWMSLQTRLFYRMWFFGVGYFWLSWIFVLVFVIAFVVAILRNRKTIAQIMTQDVAELSESTERLI